MRKLANLKNEFIIYLFESKLSIWRKNEAYTLKSFIRLIILFKLNII